MRTVGAASILLFALLLSACNTMQGIGRDVSSVGKTVERAAK